MKDHSPQFLKIAQAAQNTVPRCSVAEVKQRIAAGEHFTLIDVREESEFAAGSIPNAIHLSKGIIERDIEKAIPDFEEPLVLYCGGGFRSAMATANVRSMGYVKAISMDGGWTAWQDSQ